MQTLLVQFLSNGKAEIEWAILAFLYHEEFVKTSIEKNLAIFIIVSTECQNELVAKASTIYVQGRSPSKGKKILCKSS